MTVFTGVLRNVQCIHEVDSRRVMGRLQMKTKIDSQQVTNALHATGSSDPDVLFACKEELLAGNRRLRATAAASIFGGVAISLTLVGAVVGVPAIRRGLAMKRRAAENSRLVESAYCAYLARTAEERKKEKSTEVRTF